MFSLSGSKQMQIHVFVKRIELKYGAGNPEAFCVVGETGYDSFQVVLASGYPALRDKRYI